MPEAPTRRGYNAVMIGHFLNQLLLELRIRFYMLVNPGDAPVDRDQFTPLGPYLERYGRCLVALDMYDDDVDPLDEARHRAHRAGDVAGDIAKLESLLDSLFPEALQYAGEPPRVDEADLRPGMMRVGHHSKEDVDEELKFLDKMRQQLRRVDDGDFDIDTDAGRDAFLDEIERERRRLDDDDPE
jgi:hypothetical protein